MSSKREGLTMNIHEFQAKNLLSSYGLSVPPGKVAITPQEAADIARELGSAMIGSGRYRPRARISDDRRQGAGPCWRSGASRRGGDDVGELVRAGQLTPERLALGTGTAPGPDKIAAFAAHLGLEGTSRSLFCRLVADLCRAFVELDASLIEINPLVVDQAG